jgi:5-bromo-4-chloroindolyl phosphate hydrolysis protein
MNHFFSLKNLDYVEKLLEKYLFLSKTPVFIQILFFEKNFYQKWDEGVWG